MHWLRLLLSLLVLSLGGGTLVSVLLGRPAAWLTAERPAHVTALLAAYLVFFTTAGQPLYHWYRYRPLRDVWQLVASAQAATGAAAGVEAGLALGLQAPAAVLLGVLGGNGGALLAEGADLLLQGHTRYTAPIHGPGPGAILAVWGAIAYAALRTLPPALLGGAAALGAPPPATAALQLLAAALPPPTCRALVLLAVAAANYGVPGRPLAAQGSSLLGYLLPLGFQPIWDSTAAALQPLAPGSGATAQLVALAEAEREELLLAPPPWPLDAGMFGYEVSTLREIEARCAGRAEAEAEAAEQGRRAEGKGRSSSRPPAGSSSSSKQSNRKSIG